MWKILLKITVKRPLPECNNNESPATQLCKLHESALELLGKFSRVFQIAGQQCVFEQKSPFNGPLIVYLLSKDTSYLDHRIWFTFAILGFTYFDNKF